MEPVLKFFTDASPFAVIAIITLWVLQLANKTVQGRNTNDVAEDKRTMSLIQLAQSAQTQATAITETTKALKASVDAQIEFDKHKTQVLEAIHKTVLSTPDAIRPDFVNLQSAITARMNETTEAIIKTGTEATSKTRIDILAAIATVPEALRTELVPMLAALSELTDLARANMNNGVTLVTSIRAVETNIQSILERFPLISVVPTPPRVQPLTLAESANGTVKTDKPDEVKP